MPKTLTRAELDELVRREGVKVVRNRSEAERLAKAVSLEVELRFHTLSQQVDRLDERIEKLDSHELVAALQRDVTALRKQLEELAGEVAAQPRPTSWEFDVQRDSNGKLTKVVAKPKNEGNE
jgi:hypothetical protein